MWFRSVFAAAVVGWVLLATSTTTVHAAEVSCTTVPALPINVTLGTPPSCGSGNVAGVACATAFGASTVAFGVGFFINATLTACFGTQPAIVSSVVSGSGSCNDGDTCSGLDATSVLHVTGGPYGSNTTVFGYDGTDLTAPPAPEILISGLGVEIADGDTSPAAADDTDFGSLDISGGTNANTFIITNSGSATLNLTGTPRVTIGGTHAADFTLTTDAATTVADGGGTTTFVITFDPSATGVRTATVSIANNDADENPYNFSIQGTGSDGTAPTLAEVTSVPPLSNDTTPSYTFNSDEAGPITVGGDCILVGATAVSGNNTITFDTLPAGIHSNCTITVTDAAGNASAPLSVSSFTIDTGRPAAILSFQDNPLSDSTNFTSVTIRFTENVTGFDVSDLDVSGGTLTGFTSTSAQDYAVTFTATDGVEVTGSVSLAGSKFTDLAGNTSGRNASANVSIDTLNPTLTQVTPVPTPANDATPDYIFNSDEAGPITVGGDCILVGTTAVSGSNTITFDALAAGTHSNCTVTVTDAAGNASDPLAVPSFTIDTGAPTLTSFTRKTPATQNTNADTLVFLATFSKDVVNVGTNDFEVDGSTATITSVAQVTASTYDITVSGGDLANLNSTVGVNVVASPTIADGVGNALATGEPATDETYSVINNTAPVITGGAVAAVNVAENQTAVTDVAATDDNDSEGSGLTYALTSGADQGKFDIDATTGVLTFKNAPDFEALGSAASSNDYIVEVTVTDSGALTNAQTITVTVTDVQAAQTIAFTNPGAQTFSTGGTVPLTVTGGGSGNAVTLVSNTPGVCTVAGSTVTMVSAGTCSITADQDAGNDFAAATQVVESFAIGQGVNTIAFTGPADTDITVGTVGLTASASSGLAVSFASTTAGVCTVAGGTVTFASVGSCSITASQAGDANFVAAVDVVRSFAITGDTVVAKTKAIISNFVSRRADRILSGTPDIASRLRRTSGGSFSGETGFSPIGFSGSGTLDNSKMAFSTSLRQVIGAGDASKKAQRRELGEMMALGEQSLLSQYNNGLQPGFDIWVKGSLDHATSETRKSDLGLLFIGADYHISSNTLVGVLAQFDWSDEKDTTNAFETDGRGWMVGPYMATRLGENLLFDGRAAYGQSSNHISPLGTYEDSFDTTRWLVSGTLTGDFNMGGWRFSPHVGVSYFEETQKAYTDNIGNNIVAQTISLGRMTFGPEISTSFKAGNGTLISPHIGLKGIWDFEKAQVIDLNTGLASGSDNDLRASIEAGITTQFNNGWLLAGEAHYDGIGDDSLEAYGGSLKLTVPFN